MVILDNTPFFFLMGGGGDEDLRNLSNYDHRGLLVKD